MWTLDENSVLSLLLRFWGPPTITVVVGGMLASVLFPRWQNRSALSKAFNERKFAILEEIADLFPRYTAARRRLVQISELESIRPLTDEENARKQSFVLQRNDARDALFSAMSRGQIYLSDDCWDTMSQFLDWDEAQTAKRLDELPRVEEWRRWETRLLTQIRSHGIP